MVRRLFRANHHLRKNFLELDGASEVDFGKIATKILT